MVKTRLSTVPEILEHIEQNIREVEHNLKLLQKNHCVSLLTVGSQESRLEGQLEILKAYRNMIIC